jgi:hypothetical protein
MLATKFSLALITIMLAALLTPARLPAADLNAPTQVPAADVVEKAKVPAPTDRCAQDAIAEIFGPGSAIALAPLPSCDCTYFCNQICAPWGGIPASACSPGLDGKCRSICCCWGPPPGYDCSPWQ